MATNYTLASRPTATPMTVRPEVTTNHTSRMKPWDFVYYTWDESLVSWDSLTFTWDMWGTWIPATTYTTRTPI